MSKPDLIELTIMLRQMDVPDMRLDVRKPENVRWLLRNLGARNSTHRHFPATIEMLKALTKEATVKNTIHRMSTFLLEQSRDDLESRVASRPGSTMEREKRVLDAVMEELQHRSETEED